MDRSNRDDTSGEDISWTLVSFLLSILGVLSAMLGFCALIYFLK